jgi:hypothetical protein
MHQHHGRDLRIQVGQYVGGGALVRSRAGCDHSKANKHYALVSWQVICGYRWVPHEVGGETSGCILLLNVANIQQQAHAFHVLANISS